MKCIARVRDEILAGKIQILSGCYDRKGGKVVEFISRTLQGFLLSQPQIVQVLVERFPYKKLKLEQQYLYFRMMTELAVKCESAEEQIIGICVERFLQIDADIEATHKAMIITDAQQIEEKLNVSISLIVNRNLQRDCIRTRK